MASKRRRPAAPGGYTPSSEPPVESPQAEAPAPRAARPVFHEKDRIGDILRRVREHRGDDIEPIADYLRIRPSFLEALEESRYEDLPADAYVIGFLRTYANFLGLDGKGAIDQYRREMAGRRRKPQLSMPQPMSEGRAPTIAVLVGAAVACLFIYGLWYGLSTPDREVIEKPLPLPAAAVEETKPANPASEALAASPAGDLLLQTTTGASATAASLAATATLPAQTATAQPAEAQPATAADKKTAEPAKDEKAKDEKPESFGEPGKARVVVRAEKESWVLITDSKGLTVFDRTLKPGETYHVPAGKGLTLTTGNVAGIAFALDGADLPRLPTTGRVARGVPLDADKLKARLTAKPKPAEEAGKPAETATEKAPEAAATKGNE